MIAEGCQYLVGIQDIVTVVSTHHVYITSILVRIGKFQFFSTYVHTGRSRERNLGLTLGTTLGRNQDNTVSTTHTEYRCCRSILQYGDALDFVRVNLRHVTFHAIDLNQRSSIRILQCSNTTHINICRIGTRFTGILHGRNTGHLTGKNVVHRTGRSFQQVVTLH